MRFGGSVCEITPLWNPTFGLVGGTLGHGLETSIQSTVEKVRCSLRQVGVYKTQ